MGTNIAKGVWPVMVTPFTETNQIDYDAVLELLQWYDEQQVTGIFAVCQSSEMFFLSWEERLSLIKFILKNAPKRMGIIASGHVATKVEDQISEAQQFIDSGIDSYVFITNQFAKQDESEDVAKKRIEYLLDHIQGNSFGIYECPYPYKRLVSPELLSWCAKTDKFGFLKDTCCNLEQLKAKISAVEGTSLQVFNANAATLLESLKMGAAGYSGVMANFHAELYVWLCNHFKNNPKEAEMLQDFLGLASVIECQVYPVNAKYHLGLEGLDINLFSRVQDFKLLTPSKQLEVEQLHRAMRNIKSRLL